MKKRFFCMLCLLVWCPMVALAAVPDDVLHDAIMTLTWPDDSGECWVEGHVVLGESEKGNSTEIYLLAWYSNYGFMDGVFTDTGGGSIGPRTLIFDHTQDGYQLREIIEPEDGTEYAASIQRMMPAECVKKMSRNAEENRAEMKRQMVGQAQSYLDSIGRSEPVQDWRERELQLSGMFVPASNFMIDFSWDYPLWVTSREGLEDGVRYVYTREWFPQTDTPDGQTGTQRLTKTRYEDAGVVETITAEVQTDSLTITFADDGGSITYAFSYDGRNYQQLVISSVGECGADQSGILFAISRLEQP